MQFISKICQFENVSCTCQKGHHPDAFNAYVESIDFMSSIFSDPLSKTDCQKFVFQLFPLRYVKY